MGAILKVSPKIELQSQSYTSAKAIKNTSISIHSLLKAETQSLHHKLDSNAVLQELLSPSLNQEYLGLALKGFYIAYNSLRQQGILKSCSQLSSIDFKQLPYTLWLTADLTRLNQRPIYLSCQDKYQPITEAELLGCLYVILGSSMGSIRISNVLKNHNNKSIKEVQFFSKVAENSFNFRQLLNEIEVKVTDPLHKRACINAAKSTFNIFIESFEIVCKSSNIGKVSS